MKALTKDKVWKMLKQGAQIEFTSCGLKPEIYVRLGKQFERVNRASFYALRSIAVIKLIKQEKLTQIWVISGIQAGVEPPTSSDKESRSEQ